MRELLTALVNSVPAGNLLFSLAVPEAGECVHGRNSELVGVLPSSPIISSKILGDKNTSLMGEKSSCLQDH